MSSGYFDLIPAELVEQIFLYLSAQDIVTALRLNHQLTVLVSGSVELQYVLALQTHGMVDRGLSSLSKSDRLKELLRSEEAWRTLDLSRRTTVRVGHHASHIYDLSGGVYLLGESNQWRDMSETVALRTAELASATRAVSSTGGKSESEGLGELRREDDVWRRMTIRDRIVDIGMCLQEFDLIGIIGLREDNSDHRSSHVILHLMQYSTGHPHPLANRPEIIVGHSPRSLGKLSIMMEIVGPCLVLLLTWRLSAFQDIGTDVLLLVNWWTGDIVLREEAPKRAYGGFVFLTPDLLFLPNALEKSFEIIELPDLTKPRSTNGDSNSNNNGDAANTTGTEFKRVAQLGLPELRYNITTVTCRSDPNPFGARHPKCAASGGNNTDGWGSAPERERPFSADPTKALVLIQFLLHDPNTGAWERLNLVAPRDKLVAAVRKHIADSQSNIKKSTPEHGRRESPPSGPAWIRQNAQGELFVDFSAFQPVVRLDDEDEQYVPWEEWGPGSARWCAGEETQSIWITTSAGERYVGLRVWSGELVVKDFNSYRVKRFRMALENAKRIEHSDDAGESNENGGNDDEDDDAMTDVERKETWLDELTSVRLVESDDGYYKQRISDYFEDVDWEQLPFVEITSGSSRGLNLSGVLVDEQRIIGLRHDLETGAITEFDVFSM